MTDAPADYETWKTKRPMRGLINHGLVVPGVNSPAGLRPARIGEKPNCFMRVPE